MPCWYLPIFQPLILLFLWKTNYWEKGPCFSNIFSSISSKRKGIALGCFSSYTSEIKLKIFEILIVAAQGGFIHPHVPEMVSRKNHKITTKVATILNFI